MAFHVVALAKLMLHSGGGQNHSKLLLLLLFSFALKLPFTVTCSLTSAADLLLGFRLFHFRLTRIFLDETPAAQRRRGRWQRALQLLHLSAVTGGDDSRFGTLPTTDEETLNAISMLAL